MTRTGVTSCARQDGVPAVLFGGAPANAGAIDVAAAPSGLPRRVTS